MKRSPYPLPLRRGIPFPGTLNTSSHSMISSFEILNSVPSSCFNVKENPVYIYSIKKNVNREIKEQYCAVKSESRHQSCRYMRRRKFASKRRDMKETLPTERNKSVTTSTNLPMHRPTGYPSSCTNGHRHGGRSGGPFPSR